MASQLLDLYRQHLASQGLVDPRPDDYVIYDLGNQIQQSNPTLFEKYPDFRDQFYALREANAPSLAGEAGRGLKAGFQGLASTAAGVGALLTGSDFLKRKATEFQQDAAENAPTIPSMEDIGGTKDAIRYGVAKVAGSVPALAEGVGMAVGGAALGSALGPEGTIVGGVEGGIEGFLGRGIVKAAIRRLLAKKVLTETTEGAVADAIKAGAPDLLKAVQTEASSIAKRRAGTAANALNMYALNAGGLYNETGSRKAAALGGAVSAVPAVVLPEIVLHKLYPGIAKGVGQTLGSQYVTRLATEALKDAGVLGSAMALQETSNVIVGRIARDEDPTDLSAEDWKRIREAAVGGALTGPLAAPLTAAGNAASFDPAAARARAEAARTAAAERAMAPGPAAAEVPAEAVETPPAISPARRATLMTDAQKTARLAELTARQQNLTPDEQAEFEVLRATAPKAGAVAEAPVEPMAVETAPAPTEIAPAEAPALAEGAPSEPQILPPAREESAAAPAEPAPPTPPAPPAPVEAATFALTKELAGAKPRYSYGDKQFTLTFDSDLDKAAYILAQKTPSKRDADYLAAVVKQTGMTEQQARDHGALVRAQIKEMAKEAEGGQTLEVAEVPRAGRPAPVVFRGIQPGFGDQPAMELWNLTEAIPGHPKDSTLARQTLENEGYTVPPAPVSAEPQPTVVVGKGGQPAEAAPSALPAPPPAESAQITPSVVPAGEVPAAVVPPQPRLGEAPPPSVPESPVLEQRLRDELAKPPSFSFGKIDETVGTMDLHDDPRFANLTGEQANRIPVENWGDESGNRSRTRVAVVLEAPDGHYVKAGLLPEQEMAAIGGAGERAKGPAVQSMAAESRRAGKYQKSLKEGGSRPALLGDLIDAGYKLRAVVHFDEEPGKIFQRFDSRQAYDASYGATEKSTGTAAQKVIPTSSSSEGVERNRIVGERAALETQIDSLSKQLSTADPATSAEINDQIRQLYRQLGDLPEPRLMTEAAGPRPTLLPIEADHAQMLSSATAAARQAGLKVDVLTEGLLRANLTDELTRRSAALEDAYMRARPADQPGLQARIERLHEQISAMDSVRGVTYTPWHIAIGLQDVQGQNINGLVGLLHEVGHSIIGRSSPEMQGRIIRAVNGAMSDLAAEHTALAERTGVRVANLADPEELLVSTMAQRLSAEGVPDSPSLARAIVQWIKDLYYRLAMGVQAAFGRTPDSQLALDWFENQLRRTIGGDYDYRFAGIFDRFQPEVPSQEVVRFQRTGSTPADVTDFYDSTVGRVRQPDVLPDSIDAINWNLRFMSEDDNPGKSLDIPSRESRARIMGAAINETSALLEKAYLDIAPTIEGEGKMPFDQFWTLVGKGLTPKTRLADLEQKFPGSGSAVIGGERMNDTMNIQARVEAKKLLKSGLHLVVSKEGQKTESGARAEENLVDRAKLLNKIEGDLRNADMHEGTLRDSIKELIRGAAKGIRRGLDTAFAAGGLARAVREVEGLSERDPIPPEYQKVFKAILADEVRVFDYAEAIAKLDLPLKEMTRAEIMSAIQDNAAGDNVLDRLVEPKNKPLLVALTELARKNAVQMDLLQMRAIKDPEKYLALKAQLDEIKSATPKQLTELGRKIAENRKAATFADRIRQNAIKARAALRRSQETIKETDAAIGILRKMRTAFADKIDEMERNGLPAPSEWMPFPGEEYIAMKQGEDGKWRSVKRTLDFNPDGTAVNGAQVLGDLSENFQYLENQKTRSGTKNYELVKRMTNGIKMIDVFRTTPEIKRVWFEKFFLSSSKMLASGGGAGAAQVERMFQRFQFLAATKYWHSDFEGPSIRWANQQRRVTELAGMKDQRAFIDQVYEPVLYQIESEPGRDEPAALREAVRTARARLTTTPLPGFDEAFKEFLRQTKSRADNFERVARESGLWTQDEKLGELRQAIPRGWLTVPRSMDTAAVSTILRDMGNAGWKAIFKDAETGVTAVKSLDKGVAARQRVVGAASFDDLLPEGAKNEQDAQARTAVLENPAAFSKAISGFFTPGIVERWLKPFINKPGESAFRRAGEEIDPLDVQKAWEQSGGDVAKWIDTLGERIGLEKNIDLDEEMMLGDLSLEAQWRVDTLKNLDDLFLMASRIAADSNQVRGLFDPTSKPPNLIMYSRENELMPPEFLHHMTFDERSTRNALATLAFHAAFGRNGETMVRAIGDIQGGLRARKQAFSDIVSQTNSEADRRSLATRMGYDWKDLKRAASIYHTVEQGLSAIKAQFGFNSPATMLNDVRGGLELLHFIAAQTTNNVKTSGLNFIQPVQRAIARKSLGAVTIRNTAGAYGEIGKQFFGGILERFGIHMAQASRHAATIGASQGQGIGNLPWTETAGIRSGKRGENMPPAINAMRAMSALQRKGVSIGFGKSREFPRPQVLPVVGNVMHYAGLLASVADGLKEANAVEMIVNASMRHFAANPDHLDNPAYRLTHSDISAQDRTFAMDKGAFDYMRAKMVEYGIGPLERVTRDAMERQSRGEEILTDEQVLQASQIANNEVDLQPSITTNPAIWDTNPVLKFATPLLGWPLRQMGQMHEAMRNAEGRATALQAMKTLGILAAWSMPMGLAFTFLTDIYDDKFLKKKTNLGNVDKTAAIPVIGPALALATSDLGPWQQLVSMAQRLSRAGNIYGLGFDAATAALTGTDPTSGQRPFSMDGRVLAFSQIMNLSQALSNWYNSGFATTYANFERPLMLALTGSGPLQAVEVLGNALGLDNQEMRITQRTNSSQWLRAAGRELGVELRRSGGGSVAPTPTSVWTREMYLAALANDRLDYMDSYRRAIDAARDEGSDDPEGKVLESWRSRNPLDVFRRKPNDTDLARMLSVMSPNGQEAVQSSLRLYKQYTDLISKSPIEQYEHRILARARQVPNINSIRARMAGNSLGMFSYR